MKTFVLSEYSKSGIPVNRRLVRKKAIEYSQYSDRFKASKGWLEKFMKRYKLSE